MAPGYPAAGITGPGIIRVVRPNDVVCNVFTDQATTIGLTLLYVQSGSYYLTDAVYTASVCVALALQTTTRSASSPGLCQARLDRHIFPGFGVGKYSSTRAIHIPSTAVTSGTTYGQMISLRSAQAGGTVRAAHHRLHLTGAGTSTGGSSTGGAAWVFELSSGGATGVGHSTAALGAVMAFKTGGTVGATRVAALACKVENTDSTPAALTASTVVCADFSLQMNEDPGTLAQMGFATYGTTDPSHFFIAETGAAVKFEAQSSWSVGYTLKVRIEGNTYYLALSQAK